MNILIADNQALTHEGVINVLSDLQDLNIIGKADSQFFLEKAIAELKPDVIIIDPYYDDEFDLSALKAKFPASRFLVLSNLMTRNDTSVILGGGVTNYVCKECAKTELIKGIYATYNNEQFFCDKTSFAFFGDPSAKKTDDQPQLSTREVEIIHLIAGGMTNQEIADKLFLSFHTIKSHRKNIIKKLGFSFKNTSELASLIKQQKAYLD